MGTKSGCLVKSNLGLSRLFEAKTFLPLASPRLVYFALPKVEYNWLPCIYKDIYELQTIKPMSNYHIFSPILGGLESGLGSANKFFDFFCSFPFKV